MLPVPTLGHVVASSSALVPHAPPLLVLAVVIFTAHAMARVAERLRLPAITGKILGGMLLGRFGLAVFSDQAYQDLEVVIDIALAVIVFNIGSHLDVRRLVGARTRIAVIALADMAFTGGLVYLGLHLLFPSLSDLECALYGAIAIATAPATNLYLVREQQARGVFSKTLLAVVALNNVLCITAFEVVRALGHEGFDPTVDLTTRAFQLLGAFAMGLAFAWATYVIYPRWRRSYHFSLIFVSLLMMVGLAELMEISILLPCLVYGATLASTMRAETGVFDVFVNPENTLYAAFFALAGTHLDLDALATGGALGVALLGMRFVAKSLAAQVGGRLARAPETISRFLGLALIPQAGVAVGLALLVNEDPLFQHFAGALMTTVLGVVVANELIGPITATWALKWSGEAGRDRLRLVSFLEEENIVVGLHGETFQEAVEELAPTLFRVHHVPKALRPGILQSIFDREAEGATYIGQGVAIPHGIFDGGRDIIGVVGVSREGVRQARVDHDFGGESGREFGGELGGESGGESGGEFGGASGGEPGGELVHIIILIATPDSQRDRHLDVLRAVSLLFGQHEDTRDAILAARTPWQVYELLQREELQGYNPYLEAEDAAAAGA